MISYKKKIIFLHITKTGGTSIEDALRDDSSVFTKNQWAKKPLAFNAPLNHLTLNQIIRSEELTPHQLKNFFKFAFVRNPWDRVISECFCPHIQLAFKDCKTIKDKIKKVCKLSSIGYGGHFLKQSTILNHPLIDINFVGRFENLGKDYKKVCKIIGIKQTPLLHSNKSRKHPYPHYYDEDTVKLVENAYQEDILTFKYRFEDDKP